MEKSQVQPDLVPARLPKKPKAPLIGGLVVLLVLVGVGGWFSWQKFGQTPEVFYQRYTAIPDLRVKEIRECDEDIENRTFKICITVENPNPEKVSNFANKVTVQGKDKNGNSVNFTDNIVISKELNQWSTAGIIVDNHGQLFSWEQTDSPTAYVVSIELDTGEVIKEYSEKNNTQQKTLKGYPAPESLGWSCSGKKECIVDSQCEGPGQKYCLNCKCINHVACSDSDDGREPKKEGVVTKNNVGWSASYDQHNRDYCFIINSSGHEQKVEEGGQLKEFFCQVEGGEPLKKCDTTKKGNENCGVGREEVNCEIEYGSDYKCKGGRCVKNSKAGVAPTSTPVVSEMPTPKAVPTSTPESGFAPDSAPDFSMSDGEDSASYGIDDLFEVLRNLDLGE